MKIRAVGAKLFHVDGQTDTTKLAVDFRNTAHVPKNQHTITCQYRQRGRAEV